jgi:hypothetical protein
MQVKYENKQISTVNETKVLGILINNNLSWKLHIESIKTKPNSACYTMRTVRSLVSTNTLKIICHSYFHSIMTYGLLFWGNSPHSIKIFRIQKRIIWIMMGCRIGSLVKNYFLTWKYYHSLPNTFFLSWCLW